MFLALLFFAVQLLINLYATSVVTANGFDAARAVATVERGPSGASDIDAARIDAERQARENLGRYGERVTFDWSRSDADTVRLRVRAQNPHLSFFGSGLLGFDRIDRTFVMRVERFR